MRTRGQMCIRDRCVGIEEGFFKKEVDMELQMLLLNRQLSLLEELERAVDTDYPVRCV